MTKIAFIGGGSVQWTTGLVNDMALTPELRGAELVLYDIDADALKLITPICKRLVKQVEGDLHITATVDRASALRDADFVILCVGIGGNAAMRNDLEIPVKYGVYQSVGDTVGPGGLARGLRHIPFAVELARDMARLCPDAWLLNLTNPMTTICRGVTRATPIRTIGLCHEVSGVQGALAELLGVAAEQVLLEVGGINHLPVITRCSIAGQDGLALLREWLAAHDPFELVEEGELTSVFGVFRDYHAVKLSLFQETGVLYGAGDRHVAEFLPGFLTDHTARGRRYGVHLTTADHRDQLFRERHANVPNYAARKVRSHEQLAPVMAALLGGPAGQFVVNVPNVGQIDNLPRQAVVECVAHIDHLGVRPLAVGELPPAAYAVVAPHVARQELIVEAALTGELEPARQALSSDPLLRDPASVAPMFEELMAANAASQAQGAARRAAMDIGALEADLAEVNGRGAVLEATPPAGGFSVARSTIQQLLDNKAARAILEKHLPGATDDPRLPMAVGMTLHQVAPFAPQLLTKDRLAAIDGDLAALSA